jgi:DNA-binding SARP family transcriptional activator/tetratricopeptide (TPR) repeat protein
VDVTGPEPALRVEVLGPVRAWSDGQELDLGAHRQRAVLAVLAFGAGRPVSRSEIIDAVWGDDPPATAANGVYTYVKGLRRVLEPRRGHRAAGQVLVSAAAGYALALEPGGLDANVFEMGVSQARDRRAAGDLAGAARLLDDALGLWRAAALGGIAGPWAEIQRVRLGEAQLAAVEERAEVLLGLGRHAQLVAELRALVAKYPLRERFGGQLMLALYRCGRQAEALEVFADTWRLLDVELAVEPGVELRRLHAQILACDAALDPPLAGDPAALPPHPAAAAAQVDASAAGLEPEVFRGLTDLAGSARMAAPEVLAVRYSLPPDTAAFTGRDRELDLITVAVTDAAGSGGVVAIHAIGGMPGVGKTALAVHAAHLLKDRFPDRQLFVDLHSHTPGQDSMLPAVALAGLLAAAGVDARSLPADLAGRAGLWQDRMAGQRVLLVLDNAASSGQVAPLLLGGEGCLVMVTSRRHLGDLPGPVVRVQVDALTPGQAQEMFTRLAPRANAEPAAVADLVRLAGYLPLAISLLARVYARHPSWTLADLTTETRDSMLTLTAENDSVAAAFEVSYRYLTPARQQFFRHLAVHPGTTIDAYAAAALASLPLQEAVRRLDDLHGEGLLTETEYRRYGMHDLIRRYARNLAAADPAADRDQALGRLLDYYQHTAVTAQALLARRPRTMPAPAAPPAAVPGLPDRKQALAWARTERGNLLACLDHATRSGQHARVIALTSSLAGLLQQDGPWPEAITRHETAVHAACRLGDRLGEGNALDELGIVRRQSGDYQGAAEALEAALGIYRDLGDRLGQASATSSLGSLRLLTGDYQGAAEALQVALGMFRGLGDRLGEGDVLYVQGVVQRLTGDYQGAAEALEAALGIYRDLGDRRGQGNALGAQGSVRLLTGDYRGAAEALEAALGIYRDLGDRGGEGSALNELGVVRRLTGDHSGAAEALETALGIFRDLGHRLGEGNGLIYLGAVRRQTGDYQGAAEALEAALGIFRDIGDPGGEAEALNEAGALHRLRGDLGQAGACHRQALTLAREISSSLDEACALAGLGRCALADGRTASAEANLRQAQEIFHSIGAAEAQAVTAELAALTDVGPPAEWH